MNALLNINVRVNSAAANAAVKELQKNVAGINTAASAASKTGFNTFLATGLNNLERFGKNLQWTGRQLEFNFTLPIALAGGAATKFALDNERAMTNVRKVYGDFNDDAGQVNAELNALAHTFELLSSKFGVHQKEVIDIAQAWASAGAAGVGLAKVTQLTLQTMILGEMSATEATQGLLAIQSAYKLNTDQLSDSIAQLNVIENQTSITFPGLIDVLTRAGGAAGTAGIDIRHLAAMAAALVPATGSASQAGNALRTIISRITAPTKEAAEVMQAFGINVLDSSWQAKTGEQRFEELARSFGGLSQSQKNVASALIASRWQINRFDILLEDMNKGLNEATRSQSSWAKALDATGGAEVDEQERLINNARAAKELATVLSSSPRAFSILTTTIQNAMAKAILPLLPAIIGILGKITQLITWFANLDPATQQVALGFLVLLALIGPVTKYVGALSTLVATLGKGLEFVLPLVYGLASGVFSLGLSFIGLLTLLGRAPFLVIGKGFELLLGFIPYLLSGFSALGTGLAWIFTTALPTAIAGGAAMIGRFVAWIPTVLGVLPGIVLAVGELMLHAWTAITQGFQIGWYIGQKSIIITFYGTTYILGVLWTAFVTSITTLWEGFVAFWSSFPTVASAVWAAVTAVWTAGITVLEALYSGFAAFMEAMSAVIELAMASPWVTLAIAVAAIATALVAIFWDDIVGGITSAIDWIVKQFNKLPVSIRNVFSAIIRFIASAIKQIREWLSYLNPFARHSPSLVDSVKAGVATILDEYGKLAGISGILRTAIGALEDFKAASAGGASSARAVEFSKDREEVVKQSPDAGDEFDRIVGILGSLDNALSAVGQQLTEQQTLVDNWTASLEARMKPINDAIAANEIAQKRLRLEILRMDTSEEEYRKLEQAMKPIEDQIFANELAQKRLRLEITKMQQVSDAAYRDLAAQMKPVEDELFNLELAQKRLKLEIIQIQQASDAAYRDLDIQMRPFEDQAFANEIAQKKLRLEIMKMEDAGQTVDDLKDKMASLAGEIETLRGQKEDLRLAGAGSEILNSYDQQIDALQQQHDAMEGMKSPIDAMTKQLADLQRQDEEMNLEKSLKFDPLKKQLDDSKLKIDDMEYSLKLLQTQADIMDLEKSLKFDPLKKQLDDSKLRIDEMEYQLKLLQNQGEIMDLEKSLKFDPLKKQIDDSKAKVDELKNKLAELQVQGELMSLEKDLQFDPEIAALEEQKNKLADLKSAYSDINGLISDMEKGLKAASQAASSADQGSFGQQEFAAAAGGDFPTPGGDSVPGLGREGGLPDIEAFNKQLEDDLQKQLVGLGDIDMFKPIKDMWNEAWKWIDNNIAPVVQPIIDEVIGWFNGMDIGTGEFGKKFDDLGNQIKTGPLGDASTFISDAFDDAVRVLKDIWNNVLHPVFDEIEKLVKEVVRNVVKEFQEWEPTFDKVGEVFGHIADVAGYWLRILLVIIKFNLTMIMAAWNFFWPIIKNVVEPVFNAIVEIVRGLLQQLRGVINFVMDLINGEWGKLWDDFKTIVGGVWDVIFGIFRGAWEIIQGIVIGLVDGIIGFFTYLYDELVGNSIIPDMVNAIIGFFQLLVDVATGLFNALWTALQWAWENIGKPIFDIIKWYIENIVIPILQLWLTIATTIFNAVWTALKWAWENIGKPIFDIVKWYIENVVVPVLKWLFERGKEFFGLLWGAVKWAWDNVGKPIFDAIAGFVNNILVPAFNFLKDIVGLAFKVIGDTVGFYWNNVINPVFNWLKEGIGHVADAFFWFKDHVIGPVWDTIGNIISGAWDGIRAIMEGGVNGVIFVVNVVGDAINAVADFVGLGRPIGHINNVHLGGGSGGGQAMGAWRFTHYAKGGIPALELGGGGGKVNTPHGIVGEGSRVFPEYVIPTDPRYRGNAFKLFEELGGKLMAEGGVISQAALTDSRVPKYGGGNIFGDVSDLVDSFLGEVVDAAETIKKFWDLINSVVDKINSMEGFFRNIALKPFNMAKDWARDQIPGLAAGGIVNPTPGGTLFRLGEAGRREIVQPLPADAGIGTTEIHFHGDLSFPNITKPNDAKTFIRNLESLAGSNN